jgi:hypothetical protein
MNKYAYNSGKGFEAQFGGGYLIDVRNGGQTHPSTFKRILLFIHQSHSYIVSDTLPLYTK